MDEPGLSESVAGKAFVIDVICIFPDRLLLKSDTEAVVLVATYVPLIINTTFIFKIHVQMVFRWSKSLSITCNSCIGLKDC